ncbi:MAG: hypothetical protein ABSG99_04830 [Sedimentisphaerales bacterium]
MFSEIIELIGYAVKAFTDVRNKVDRGRNGGRVLYDLYRNLDEISQAAISSLNSFELSQECSDARINERLDILSKAVKGFIGSFEHAFYAIAVFDEELSYRLAICLSMKSWWYREFAQLYCAGRLDGRAKKLKKKCLKMSFDVEKWRERFKDYHYITRDPEFQREVLIQSEVDLSDEKKIEKLIQEGQKNVDEIKVLKQKLKEYLKENFALKDLLDMS